VFVTLLHAFPTNRIQPAVDVEIIGKPGSPVVRVCRDKRSWSVEIRRKEGNIGQLDLKIY